MTFNNFLKNITQLKTAKLAGKEAHFRLAPELRKRFDETEIQEKKPRKAAVLGLLYPDENNETCLLLTQRSNYKGTHAAQVSFPGGKVEKSDKNHEETALRESFEEVGIPQNDVHVFKELTEVYIPPSNFLVTPFLGFVSKKPSFKINYEVEKIIEMKISELLDDSSVATTIITNSYMRNTEVPCFTIQNYPIWGATGMMLSEIKELIVSKVL